MATTEKNDVKDIFFNLKNIKIRAMEILTRYISSFSLSFCFHQKNIINSAVMWFSDSVNSVSYVKHKQYTLPVLKRFSWSAR